MPHDPPHDPPEDDVLDEPLIGVKINQHWMSHVIGLASVTADQDYWASDQERGEEQAIAMLDILAKGNLPVFDPLSARVRRTTPQLIPYNVSKLVTFDTVLWDVGGLYNPAAPDRLELAEPGLWHLGAGISWASHPIQRRYSSVRILPATDVVWMGNRNQDGQTFQDGSTIWKLTASAFVALRVLQTSGVSLNVHPFQDHAIDLWAHYLGPI